MIQNTGKYLIINKLIDASEDKIINIKDKNKWIKYRLGTKA